MAAILKRADRTARGRAQGIGSRPVKHQGRTAGARLADLAGLGKAIMLSEFAKRKWDPRPYGYVPHPTHPTVQGACDATGVVASNLTLFIKER